MPALRPSIRIASSLAAASALLLLAGCGSSGSDAEASATSTATSASEESCVDTTSGEASDAVEVSGDIGEKPDVSFTAPLDVDETERTFVVTGDGEETAHGDMVGIELSLYNAESGELVNQTSYAGGPAVLTVSDSDLIPALVRAIECAPTGSRVVTVAPASDAWGDTGSSDGAVAAGEGVVIVADILSITPDAATGEPVDADPSLPQVTLADDGTPTIGIPDADPPSELQLGVLKQGDGAEVADGDTVTVQYIGVNWRTKEAFDQSWGNGDPAQFSTADVIEGFTDALVGQKVGSQVIVVIPPDLGYGSAGSESAGIEGTDTIVFVIDILATSR